MYKMNEKKENENEKQQEQKAFEILKNTRTIVISGEIDQKLAEKVTNQLLYLESVSDDPIKLFINSQGGHVEAGDTIHDMIKFVKPEVVVVGTGWVASAGVTIYIAAKKKNRYTLPNTRFLIHQPLGGVTGQASDIDIEAKEIIKMRERIYRLIAEATGQKYEKIKKDSDRNFWLTADEAKEYGIVNEIIESRKELDK